MAFSLSSDDRKEEEERVVWWHAQWIYYISCHGREERMILQVVSLVQSAAISAPR